MQTRRLDYIVGVCGDLEGDHSLTKSQRPEHLIRDIGRIKVGSKAVELVSARRLGCCKELFLIGPLRLSVLTFHFDIFSRTSV